MTEDNVKLAKELGDRFKCSVDWNKYTMIPDKKGETKNGVSNIRKVLASIFQGVKRLLAYVDSNANGRVKGDSYQKYFLPRVNIENNNIGIGGRHFMISKLIIQSKSMKKLDRNWTKSLTQINTSCLLDYVILTQVKTD